IKDRRAVKPLINALQDESKYVRIQAAYSLGKIRDERAIIPLIQLFQDRVKFPDEGKYPPYVVEAASHALSRIGEPSIGPLIEVVKDDSALLTAHYQASEALGRIGKPAAKQLITALKDASLKKGWLAIALGKTGDKKAVELLIRALKDEDREIRWRSAKVLQNLKDVQAIHPLIEALEDEDDNVAGHAAIALRDMGPPALEPLVKAFKEKKGKVRSHVTWDLGAVGDMSVVDLLIEALQDECWKVREYAIQSLGEIVKRERKKTQKGNSLVFKLNNVKDLEEQVIKSITQALKDTHPDVRCRAVRILGALQNKQVTALLTEALNDEDINVRNAAQDVLNRIKRDENHH
ncbi:MAG: HEAT repeat domain-containing protein, partial [Theionarchaea archaeon]|nr:HEAT repeat domain-containing protein [Theionarchaea archaeon]